MALSGTHWAQVVQQLDCMWLQACLEPLFVVILEMRTRRAGMFLIIKKTTPARCGAGVGQASLEIGPRCSAPSGGCGAQPDVVLGTGIRAGRKQIL